MHAAVDGAGVCAAAGAVVDAAAGVPGHLPHVVWQKFPSNMKGALHFPNPFCRHAKQLGVVQNQHLLHHQDLSAFEVGKFAKFNRVCHILLCARLHLLLL